MQITVNGESKKLEAGITVLQMLEALNITPERVVVELNMKILKRDERVVTKLKEGDQVEIVHFVGGGA